MTVHVTVAGDPQQGDPKGVRQMLVSRYGDEAAAYSIDLAYLPDRGYHISNASRMTPSDPSARTDRTGPFKMPATEDATDEVRAYLRSQGITVVP